MPPPLLPNVELIRARLSQLAVAMKYCKSYPRHRRRRAITANPAWWRRATATRASTGEYVKLVKHTQAASVVVATAPCYKFRMTQPIDETRSS